MVAYYRRGEAYHADHHDDSAIRDLREASRIAPDAVQPLVALGEVYDSRNEPINAARWVWRGCDRLRDEIRRPTRWRSRVPRGIARGRHRPAAPGDRRNDSVAQTHTCWAWSTATRTRSTTRSTPLRHAIKIAPSLTPAREELADLFRSQNRSQRR
jgi:hypothetical protein